jgi:hypothetical protein
MFAKIWKLVCDDFDYRSRVRREGRRLSEEYGEDAHSQVLKSLAWAELSPGERGVLIGVESAIRRRKAAAQ